MDSPTSTELEPTVKSWARFSTEPLEADNDPAEEFHEASKFYASSIGRMVRGDRLTADPTLARSAATAARDMPHLPRTPLPRPAAHRWPDAPVRESSGRLFARDPLPLDVVGDLLALSYRGEPRPVASAGALYPLEIYLIADLTGTGAPSVHHYDVAGHGLEELRAEVPDEVMSRLAVRREDIADAPLIVVIAGLFGRSRFKYGLRGYRFCLLEAGALIQQIQLVASAMGMVSLPYAGLFDDVVEDLCELDGVDESFLNAVVVGRPGTGA
jgi:SagB-type dehydrogenase family enzyme